MNSATNAHPLVSVIIPCYNCARTVEEAVSSVVEQTVRTEILIYNDASDDETLIILQNLEKSHSNIKVYSSLKNKGAGYARDFLLKKSSGEFIAFLDADDIWMHNKLDLQVTQLNKSGADICLCNYDVVDVNYHLIKTIVANKKINYFNMHFGNHIPMSMSILKSSLVGAKNMPLLRSRQDYAYWLKLFRNNRNLSVTSVNKTLGVYRKMFGSLSGNPVSNVKSNFKMFHFELKYNLLWSSLFVSLNIIKKILKM